MIRRGAHENAQTLEAGIRRWVKDRSEGPEPFVRPETAEGILDSLARLCRRISGAGRRAQGAGPGSGPVPGLSVTSFPVLFLLLFLLPSLLEPAQQFALPGPGVEPAADASAAAAAAQGLAAEVLPGAADAQHVSGSASGHGDLPSSNM
ncbi:hypothetical protein APS67_005980 [Streptomyces sp. AVP053U2]|nr:hypothetical protein APS67_005980 [Streptomyces sp. AVP053U2]